MKDQTATAPHEYAQHLDQSERLAAYAGARFDEEMNEPDTVALSAPPDGFRMPSMSKVRMHDARMMAGMVPTVSTHEDEEDEEDESEESELRVHALTKRMDGMKEHSFRLPSQRSRADVRDMLRSMGCSFHD